MMDLLLLRVFHSLQLRRHSSLLLIPGSSTTSVPVNILNASECVNLQLQSLEKQA